MNVLLKSIVAAVSVFAFASASAQKTAEPTHYSIKVQIDNLADSNIYLGYYYGDKQYVKDTIKLDKKGRGEFAGKEPLNGGMYFVLVPGNSIFELPIDQEQVFSLTTKFTGSAADLTRYLRITNAPELEYYADYQQFMQRQNEIAIPLNQRARNSTNAAERQRAKDSLNLLYQQVQARWAEVDNLHPKSILAALLRINREIDIPDFPRDENGNVLDSAFQYKYYKAHYFDNIDLNDARLIRTNFLHQKINYYFEKMILPAPDTIIKESRALLDGVTDTEMFKYLLQSIFNKYNSSNIMGMDKVVVFFGDYYYLNGRTPWADPEWLEKLRKRVEELRYNSVGNQAVELKLYTVDDEQRTLSSVNAEYTIMFFFEPSCGHCKKATPKMKELADEYWSKGVEVFAVYTQTNKEEWTKFIEAQGLENWINVWDPYNQSYFRHYYDISSTPSIYLLDRHKKILAKRIDVDTLRKVLEDEFNRKK